MTPSELKVWRAARNMTQDDVATLLKVTRKTVVRWEKGQHSIPSDTMDKLEAHSPAIKMKQPAVLITRRVRAFPWAQRDYTENEIDRLPAGAKVWRTDPSERDAVWCIKVMLATKGYGKGLHFDICDVKLPLEAFPDRAGIEAPWARDMFNARMDAYTAERIGLRQAMRDSGIPEEE